MAIDLSSDQLNALSVPEKLRLLEQVWQSLCNQPAEILSPEWHAEVLCERARRLADGEAVCVPWRESNPICSGLRNEHPELHGADRHAQRVDLQPSS